MTAPSISNTEFDQLRQLIESECGIAVGNDKVYLVETRLSKLLAENACNTYGEFYQKAKNDLILRDKIIDAMTTNETLWFRDNSPYKAMQEYLFPEFIKQLRSGQKRDIRIWSAACSTGQEPYSISIVAHELARLGQGSELSNGQLSITATDISSSALLLAKIGRYDPISISRGMPEDLKQRYFKETGRAYALDDKIKSLVQFKNANLLKPFDHLGRFDVVMLRNVAIYFSTDFKKDLYKRLANILNPGGYLFLGASESLIGYSQDFENRSYLNAHFYQVKK